MPIVIESKFTLTDSILKKFRQKIEHQLQLTATVDVIKGTQSGIWGLFSELFVVSWAYDSHNGDEVSIALQDASQLSTKLLALLKESGAPNDVSIRCTMHEGILNTDKPMANQWRGLFAQAVIKLDILERDTS
jgi:hypothetical protein